MEAIKLFESNKFIDGNVESLRIILLWEQQITVFILIAAPF